MYFTYIVFSIFHCFLVQSITHGQLNIENEAIMEEQASVEENIPVDNYIFVALIDIVFTDGSKRTCTGTIIHDSVVLTAAHCFAANSEDVQPELTASFVVIGTKKMFDAGYEQYLPIERVLIHPRFRGWTADLALVYTFASMTSDKPGQIMKISVERTSTPMDSNVTVLSWGHCKSYEPSPVGPSYSQTARPDEDPQIESASIEVVQNLRQGKTKKEMVHSNQDATRYQLLREQLNQKQLNIQQKVLQQKPMTRNSEKSLYLSSGEDEKKRKQPSNNPIILRANGVVKQGNKQELKINNDVKQLENQSYRIIKTSRSKPKNSDDYDGQRALQKIVSSVKNAFHNWRRHVGSQQNKLTVEVFGFVNIQTCKKLVERAMPAVYDIKSHNDVVCYSSEEHYITDDDSGAPAVSHGHLVAVTVGGVESDGDHVAIGMKMSCYCSWIADNLPDGGANLKCCKNCCAVKHNEEERESKSVRKNNKYLLN